MKKYLHYCWFGRNPIPAHLKKCIKTWHEKMPDWEIIEWNEEKFDITSTEWTKAAYEAGKFAFVSDYVRLVALYNMGGIYLDTDVKLLKSLNGIYCTTKSFGGFENDKYITSAVIAATEGHPLIAKFIDYYNNRVFTNEVVSGNEANVIMMTDICKSYGLIINDKDQTLEIPSPEGGFVPFHIFPKTYFCPLDFYHKKNFSRNTHAVHLFDASWLDDATKKRIGRERSLFFKTFTQLKALLWRIMKNK